MSRPDLRVYGRTRLRAGGSRRRRDEPMPARRVSSLRLAWDGASVTQPTGRELRDSLPPRQLAVLLWIYDYLERHCYAPTLREIGAALGIRSTNGVNDHLRALERKGMLTRQDLKARTIVLTCEGYEAAEATP